MKLKSLLNSTKLTQLLILISLFSIVGYGLFVKASNNTTTPLPPLDPVSQAAWQLSPGLKARINLSQNKVIQGSDGVVYLQVDMEAQKDLKALGNKRTPTDFILVLDRSGSMADDKKLTYAKKAIESLINQISHEDRFALVTFDSYVETPIELTTINSNNKQDILNTLSTIGPRGSTDLGSGLVRGIDILRASQNGTKHAQRLILLSDGQANVGITDSNQLNKIASQALRSEFVISTIGVGLDFNENLLSSLADYGAGHYHFLENLLTLEAVLEKEFQGASQILAKNLKLKLNLASGIQVTDASGYPITTEHSIYEIQPGNLYYGQNKTLFITLKLPTKSVYTENIGKALLTYKIDDQEHRLNLIDSEIKIACLPPDKKEEAVSSINQGIFSNAWTKNNFGRFLKDNADDVRKGDKEGTLARVKTYKEKLIDAYSVAPTSEMKKQIEDLDAMEGEVNTAFSGSGYEKEKQLKSLSKSYQYKGLNEQRSSTN